MNIKMKEKFQGLICDAQNGVQRVAEGLRTIHDDLTSLNGVLFEETVNGFYIPKHFKIQELVPKDIFEEHKNNLPILWGLFDSRLLWTIDALRVEFDTAIYINTWFNNFKNVFQKEFQYSGFRPAYCSEGAKYSQHKYGRAVDLKIPALKIENIIDKIKKEPNKPAFKYITCIEEKINGNVPSWLHIDVRNCERIIFISC